MINSTFLNNKKNKTDVNECDNEWKRHTKHLLQVTAKERLAEEHQEFLKEIYIDLVNQDRKPSTIYSLLLYLLKWLQQLYLAYRRELGLKYPKHNVRVLSF